MPLLNVQVRSSLRLTCFSPSFGVHLVAGDSDSRKSVSNSKSLNLSTVARPPARWPSAAAALLIPPFSTFQPRSAGFIDGGAVGAGGAPARAPRPPPPPARIVQLVKSLPLNSTFHGPG